jgi:hypothetical protein
VMVASESQVERERRALLEQVNNLGKRLERTDLELALKLSEGLQKLVDSVASGKRPGGR